MKKMTTLFKKDPNDLGLVINEVNPENEWVFKDEGVIATRKWDGAACAIINGQLYKRYDAKAGKTPPPFAIPCQEPDLITGHWPHWVLCDYDNPADKYFLEAWSYSGFTEEGTYEAIGPKFQGNPEKLDHNTLVRHGANDLDLTISIYGFEDFRKYLSHVNIEGIVFHHPDGRMCKLRKSDFGIKR